MKNSGFKYSPLNRNTMSQIQDDAIAYKRFRNDLSKRSRLLQEISIDKSIVVGKMAQTNLRNFP